MKGAVRTGRRFFRVRCGDNLNGRQPYRADVVLHQRLGFGQARIVLCKVNVRAVERPVPLVGHFIGLNRQRFNRGLRQEILENRATVLSQRCAHVTNTGLKFWTGAVDRIPIKIDEVSICHRQTFALSRCTCLDHLRQARCRNPSALAGSGAGDYLVQGLTIGMP